MFIEQLTEADKALINRVRMIGIECSEEDDIDLNKIVECDSFLRFWNYNKNPLISEIFKDKLILKKKINLLVEDDELYDEIDGFIHGDDFKGVCSDIFNMLSEYHSLSEETVFHRGMTLTLNDVLQSFVFNDVESILNNKYEGPTLELKMPSGSIFKLVNGCKIMKALNRLAKEANVSEKFEAVRIRQSQILNEAKICANLCLSIHPLDYLTASYNANDWHSCMNWEEGDYRRGVIEMMNSDCVIVAYLESSHNFLNFWIDEENVQWNSKRWREFFIVSEKGIFGIKGYPYWNHHIEDTVLTWIKELLADKQAYSDKIITWDTENERISDSSANSYFSVHMTCGPAMYNDFYNGNIYHMIPGVNINTNLRLNYSGESICAICGDEGDFEDTSDIICDDCICHHVCECCGEDIYSMEDLYEFEGKEYCAHCYDYRLPHCSCCGELLSPDTSNNFEPINGMNFYIGSDEKGTHLVERNWAFFNEYEKFCVCEDCAKELFTLGLDEFDVDHHQIIHWWERVNVVPYTRIKNFGTEKLYDVLNIDPNAVINFLKTINIKDR